MALILVVDDDSLLRWALRRRLEPHGHRVREAATLAEAGAVLAEIRPDLVLLDVGLPDGSGLDFLEEQAKALAESLVLVMTAGGRVEDAVRAMKAGAWDFVTKPVEADGLAALVDEALERLRDGTEAERSRREREAASRVVVVAESEAMRRVLGLAAAVADSGATTVLIHGETGTGKEVVARALHARSSRADSPLIAVDCTTLPETLAESELFGHEKGAFTDARSTRRGVLELAHGGTVLLDEVGEIPPTMQSKLLRFLEERTFRRVGGERSIHVDVRVVALTNRDLRAEIDRGAFRRDLYYRLCVFPIEIPPLRERREDILPLARHFLAGYGSRGGAPRDFSADAASRLLAYDWPGNAREVRNVVERVAILDRQDPIGSRFLHLGPADPAAALPDDGPVIALDVVEHAMVARAMRAAAGNQSQAARLLGISRDQLRYRLTRYRDEGRLPETADSAAGDAAG